MKLFYNSKVNLDFCEAIRVQKALCENLVPLSTRICVGILCCEKNEIDCQKFRFWRNLSHTVPTCNSFIRVAMVLFYIWFFSETSFVLHVMSLFVFIWNFFGQYNFSQNSWHFVQNSHGDLDVHGFFFSIKIIIFVSTEYKTGWKLFSLAII